MWELLRGWKRKLGIVTLLAACALAAGWARSLRTHETIKVQTERSLNLIDSHQGKLVLCRVSTLNQPAYSGPPSDVIATNMQLKQSGALETVYRIGSGIRQRFDWTITSTESIGLGDSIFEDPELSRVGVPSLVYASKIMSDKYSGAMAAEEQRYTFVLFPYWLAIIPLTALSTWLLISKPRVQQQKSIPDHRPQSE